MAFIPPAVETDAEDVAWALQTADALWKRDERADAIVWLRRAAQAAGEAEDDDRALTLAREAAELSEALAREAQATPSAVSTRDILEDDSRSSLLAIMVDTTDLESEPPPPPSRRPTDPRPLLDEPTSRMQAFRPQIVQGLPAMPPPPPPSTAPQLPNDFETHETSSPPVPPVPARHATIPSMPPISEPRILASVAEPPSPDQVPTAAEAHAGMLDPWAADAPPLPVRPPVQIVNPSFDDDDDEVVTSAKPNAPRESVTTAPAPPLAELEANAIEMEPPAITRRAPVIQDAPSAPTEVVTIPVKASVTSSAPTKPAPKLAPIAPPEEPILPKIEMPKASPKPLKKADAHEAPKVSVAELESIDGLADLSDDVRAELASAATVHSLSHSNEVTGFSLAIVLEGEVDVAAVIVDAIADRIGKGGLLKPKGSLSETVPLRLICSSMKARVVTWEAAAVEHAFKSCPWVEDDLRAHADRTIALVGVTMGPLADRLDEALRKQITNRLNVREVSEGDSLVKKGGAIKEMIIVGQGVLELSDDGDVAVGSVGTGEILFGSEVLGGGKAPANVRAGKGGALVLYADRSVMQELLMTCPPLLELFAGM